MKHVSFIPVFAILFSCLILSPSGLHAQISDKLFSAHVVKDINSLMISRQAMADIILFMQKRPDIFDSETKEGKMSLDREQRLIAWQTWQAFLDHVLAMDSIGKSYSDIYKLADGKQKKTAFRVAFAAFLAQYRYAMDFIDIIEKTPDFHIVLNEPVPEIGLPKKTYSRLKFRFLNVLRGAEFARLHIIYIFYGKDSALPITTGLEEDVSAIWKAGKGRGPLQTAQNAIKIIQDTTFTAWFPVQKGVSEWMGDTKVWRKNKYLITEKQIMDILPELEPGDIVLLRREWHLSNIGLPGFWTHAALFVGLSEKRKEFFNDPAVIKWIRSHGKQYGGIEDLLSDRYPSAYKISLKIQEDNTLPRVIEALGEGVIFTTPQHALGADSLVVLRPRLSKTAKARAVFRAFHYSGRPYDFNFDFLTDSSLVCSELIYKAYKPLEDNKGLRFPLDEVLGRKVLSPNKIASLFDKERSTNSQMDLVLFMDGNEQKNASVRSDVKTFQKSWMRPKWHIVTQDM